MGLFRKRTNDPDEMARLRAEIERMDGRLAEADAEKRAIQEQLVRLHADVERQRDPAPTSTEPGPTLVTPAALEEVREHVLKLDRRLDEQLEATSPGLDVAGVEGLSEQVEALRQRFDVPLTDPPDAPPETATAADLDALRDEINAFAGRLDGVEARLVSISRELAHQIDELGSELAAREPADPADDVVTGLRLAQERLAAEQARYQIAFRHELAQLADRLRQHR